MSTDEGCRDRRTSVKLRPCTAMVSPGCVRQSASRMDDCYLGGPVRTAEPWEGAPGVALNPRPMGDFFIVWANAAAGKAP